MKKSTWQALNLDLHMAMFKFEDLLTKVTITEECPSGFISQLERYKHCVADIIDKRDGQVNISKELRNGKTGKNGKQKRIGVPVHSVSEVPKNQN